MTAPLTESFEDRKFTPEDLYGVYVKGGGVEYRTASPRLIDFIRQHLMEVNDMHAPEHLWQRLARFRQERATDPGWAAFFRGVDHLQEQNWQPALADLYESRGVFLARNDAWAASLADGFIRDVEYLRQNQKAADGAASETDLVRQQMINDDLLWQWWRITHLPWE